MIQPRQHLFMVKVNWEGVSYKSSYEKLHNNQNRWLFSSSGNNFFSTVMRLSRESTHLRMVDDQIGNPTCADEAAKSCT